MEDAMRVRGLSTSPSLTVFAEAVPHSGPLPAKRLGEGEELT
jgi:hypothetical protein